MVKQNFCWLFVRNVQRLVSLGEADQPDPFLWKFLGRNLLSMLVEGCLAFALVLFIERRRVHKQKYGKFV